MSFKNKPIIIEDTYANIATLKSASKLTPQATYYLTDKEIYLNAATNNEFEVEGKRMQWIVKDSLYTPNTVAGSPNLVYTGIYGQSITAGTYPVSDVTNEYYAIWGGRLWKRLTTGTDGTPVDNITLLGTAWILVTPNTTTNEYRSFDITYDFANDTVTTQADWKGNILHKSVIDLIYTDWGNSLIINNKCAAIYNNYKNSTTKAYIQFNNNIESIYNNKNNGNIIYNSNNGTIFNNSCGAITSNSNNGSIYSNSCLTINNNSNNASIYNNSNSGTISYNSNAEDILNNVNSGSINNNSNRGNISQNLNAGYINNNSNMGSIFDNSNNGYIDNNSNTDDINNNGNTGTGNITNNSNNGTINLNVNVGAISYNSNNGPITNNSNNGDIYNNSNTQDISNNSSTGVTAFSITYNSNNGYINYVNSTANIVIEKCNIPYNIGSPSSSVNRAQSLIGSYVLNSTVTSNIVNSSNAVYTTLGSFDAVAGEIYRMKFIGKHSTVITTTGIKLKLGGTAVCNVGGEMFGNISAASVATQLSIPAALMTTELITTGVSGANVSHTCGVDIIFQCTTGGTVLLTFASEVNTSACTILPSSTILVERLL